ncbi:unnamed protein product [Acanthoscelides obtectus]|uniref:Uncharacterized protein n=1 Tax=Acanthoscelides obtectus TaxID=200917 RepID=A0A9P0LUV5_ACAOB|nr:unnamed protein product [Acanthoscelides obtectus]CAK1641225.1 hypothetical protein AOBTE_LOCUS12253 [Acanthoscelides obtectus]
MRYQLIHINSTIYILIGSRKNMSYSVVRSENYFCFCSIVIRHLKY